MKLALKRSPVRRESAIEELSRLSYGLTEKLYATLGAEDDDAMAGESNED